MLAYFDTYHPISPVPSDNLSQKVKNTYEMHEKDSDITNCIMLASMTPKLHHNMMVTLYMIVHLKELL